MRNEKRVKNLIIGGGLSGLAMAYYLGDDYLILEKEKEPGGYCRTLPNKDYVWDYAGHFYHFRTEKYKNTIRKSSAWQGCTYDKKYTGKSKGY